MKNIRLTGLLIAMLSAILTASAYDIEVDGIYYNLNTTDRTAAVTKGDSEYEGAVVIPPHISFRDMELQVTTIGEDAFNYCKNLTSITIPNSVTTIGDFAFNNCKSLTSITIPNSVTSIGSFDGCTSLTSITIPNSVTSIGSFEGCTSLKSITIPESITKILGKDAFKDCIFDEFIFQYGEDKIMQYVYDANSNGTYQTKNLTLGRNIEFHGDDDNNYNVLQHSSTCLENLTLAIEAPNSNPYDFESCTRLKSLTLESNISFFNCKNLYRCDSITDVYSKNVIPPTVHCGFSKKTYVNGTLYVPEEAVEAYKQANVWKNFLVIKGIRDSSGVDNVASDNDNIEDAIIYDIMGRRLKQPQKGINIINGKKVYIR